MIRTTLFAWLVLLLCSVSAQATPSWGAKTSSPAGTPPAMLKPGEWVWGGDAKDMGPAGIYRVQMQGDKQAGGLMKHPMPGAPSCWVCYFLVEDLAAATAKAKQLGANAMMEGVPIPEVGAFSMLTDPAGAMFALFQANAQPGANC